MPLDQLGLWQPAAHQWRIGQRVAVLPRDQRQHVVPVGAIVGGAVASTHLHVALDVREEHASETCCELAPEPEAEQDGSTTADELLLLPSKLVPTGFRRCLDDTTRVQPSEPLLPDMIVTPETGDLRRLCRALVRKGDRVLEIGCSTGFCTRVLCRSGPPDLVVAVDTAYSCVTATEELVSAECEGTGCALEVLKLDVLLDPNALHQLVARVQPSFAVVDVGGDRALPEVVAVIDELLRAAAGVSDSVHESNDSRATASRQLDLVVVKSEELAAAAAAHLESIRTDLSEQQLCADPSPFLLEGAAWWR